MFNHRLNGIILGVSLDNNKNNLGVALAKYEDKVRERNLYFKYVVRYYNNFNHESRNEIQDYNFTEINVGDGTKIEIIAINENIIVYYRLFDDVIFSTIFRFFLNLYLILIFNLFRDENDNWKNISSSLTFKYSNKIIFQTIGLRFVKSNSNNETQLISFYYL